MDLKTLSVGDIGFDSLPFSHNPVGSQQIAATGVRFFVGYLGTVTKSTVDAALDAGMGFMPVTYANHFDGKLCASRCRALGLPTGVTVWLDFESALDTQKAITSINGWAVSVAHAGYMPGLYVGAPQPLTSDELWRLKVVRYWKGQSKILDRHGSIAEPSCGWCMLQLYPQHTRGGVFIDVNVVQLDYRNRAPVCAVRSA